MDNPNWYIVDSSKLKDYLDCPRKFFFRHIWGWESEVPNLHLVFGEAFHKLLERLMIDGYSSASVDRGMEDFLAIYRQTYDPMSDADRAPKNPAYAELAAINYIQHYKDDHEKYDVLHTEISGSVSVCPDPQRALNRLHFKMDSILKDRSSGQIFSLEHKTTGQNFTNSYLNQFLMGIQVGTYTHVLRSFYPEADVYGVYINSISLLKTKMNFQRFPIRKTPPMMQVWLDIVDDALWRMESDLEQWSEERLDPGLTMQSYMPNPQSCDRWYGCPYLDFCYAWENPLTHWEPGQDPPMGLQVNFWDPREQKTTERIEL